MEGVSGGSRVRSAGQSRGGTGSSVGLPAVDAVEQLCGRDTEALLSLEMERTPGSRSVRSIFAT